MKSGWQHETTAPTDWEQWLGHHTPALLLFARPGHSAGNKDGHACVAAYKSAVGFLAILAVLTLRPRGLLGARA